MKTIILALLFILTLNCCSDDDTYNEPQLPVTMENLVGSWQTVELASELGDGSGPGSFEPIGEENRSVVIFYNDYRVTNSRIDCDGTFQLDEENESITFDYDCIETPSPTSHVSSLTLSEMILATANPSGGGGKVKYERIPDD